MKFTTIDPENRDLNWGVLFYKRLFHIARWSPSNYAYVDQNLEPISGSYRATEFSPMTVRRINDFAFFVRENTDG